MTSNTYNLGSLFGGANGASPQFDLSGVTAGVAAATGQDAGPVTDAVTSGLNQALTLELGDVLGKAWGGAAQVKAAIAATKKNAEAVAFVPLAPHRIATTHKPNVELLMAGAKISSLPFNVVLAMDLRGVELEVRGGRIVATRSGVMVGEGSILFSGAPILKAQTPSLPLPGKLKFGEKEKPEAINSHTSTAAL
jgi:methylglyoxal synthase